MKDFRIFGNGKQLILKEKKMNGRIAFLNIININNINIYIILLILNIININYFNISIKIP